MTPLHETQIESLVTNLRDAVGPERWRVWFEGATDFRVADGGLTVGVANLFISDHLRTHFADQLATVMAGTFGQTLPVTYRVQPDLFQRRRAENLAGEAEVMERFEPTARAAPSRGERSPSTYRPLFTLDSFVVGPCNRMAYAAAKSAAATPGRDFHPLFIHGGCGLGKTHLLQGILHAVQTHPGLRTACLPAERFTNQYLACMRTGKLDAFRHRYRNLDILAIDDIHFLAGKPATQEEFLHTFDEFDGDGRLIVLASDSHPREIEAIQSRLISRWVAGLVVRISRPDADTRRRILETKAIQMGHPLAPDILALVADRVQGSVRELEGALNRIIAYAALLRAPVTQELTRQALLDFVATTPTRTSLPEIEQAVTSFFGVTASDIHSSRKLHQISIARQVCMVLARQLTDLSYADVARAMGNKNHTTVLAACRKWQELVKNGTEVAWADGTSRRTMSAEALLAHLKERIRS
ncbi:MAG TPA: chromosomal replication initiator protein DnaA [Phycisphaerae bacterium]|nr:chromosomal replication initiator protein DnaA [Phycisphaerae bacterium]